MLANRLLGHICQSRAYSGQATKQACVGELYFNGEFSTFPCKLKFSISAKSYHLFQNETTIIGNRAKSWHF